MNISDPEKTSNIKSQNQIQLEADIAEANKRNGVQTLSRDTIGKDGEVEERYSSEKILPVSSVANVSNVAVPIIAREQGLNK